MLALFLFGILYLVVFYITQGDMPLVSGLDNWNLLVGFGFIIAGFARQHAVALTGAERHLNGRTPERRLTPV